MKGWTEIISFTYPHEAHLAKTLLEAAGIEVILKDEFTVQVHNFLSNAIGGVKLLVEINEVEEALLIMKDAGYIKENEHKKKEAIKIFSYQYKDICPYCEGTNIMQKKIPGYTFVFSILLLGFPFPFLKKTYFCYDCTKEWKISKRK